MKTVKKFFVIVPALLLVCTILFMGCPNGAGGNGGGSLGISGGDMPAVPSAPDPNLDIENGVLKGYKNGKPTGILHVPAGVKKIAFGAFLDCSDLTALNLPDSVESLGGSAFSNCKEIDGTVRMPKDLKEIGAFAFNGCSKVDAFDFSQCTQLTTIGNAAFRDCNARFTVKKDSRVKEKLTASGVAADKIDEID